MPATTIKRPEGTDNIYATVHIVSVERLHTMTDEQKKELLQQRTEDFQAEVSRVLFPKVTYQPDRITATEIRQKAVGMLLRPDEPCSHPGCLSHLTHPCEGCGRIGGYYAPR